jgi:hypothetical protein
MGSQAAEEKPTAAFVLSLIGGILGLISGFAVVFAGSSLAGLFGPYYPYPYIASFLLILGVWMIISSLIILVAANGLNSNPAEHSKWGAIILIFSILGGGSCLACIGGIVALGWKPTTPPPAPRAPTPSGRRVGAPETAGRVCPQCGQVLAEDARFCPRCGWHVGD